MCALCETCMDAGVAHNVMCPDVRPLLARIELGDASVKVMSDHAVSARRWAARPASRYYANRPSEGDCCQCNYCLWWFAEWRRTGKNPRQPKERTTYVLTAEGAATLRSMTPAQCSGDDCPGCEVCGG